MARLWTMFPNRTTRTERRLVSDYCSRTSILLFEFGALDKAAIAKGHSGWGYEAFPMGLNVLALH